MQKGFSLIEIIIAVAIVALLLSLGTPAYKNMVANSTIKGAAQAFHDGLQQAKIEAIRRNVPVTFTLQNITGWSVDVPPFGTNTNIPGYTTTTVNITSRTPTANETNLVSVNPTALTLTFYSNGHISASSTIAFSSPNASCRLAGGQIDCLNITVSTGGQIRMCNPALTAPNPQAC
jgi:type IV fimbrial biogenesis protein FimT